MPITLSISLESLSSVQLEGGSCRATQGLWLNTWKEIHPMEISDCFGDIFNVADQTVGVHTSSDCFYQPAI